MSSERGRPNNDKEGHSTQDAEARWSIKAGSNGQRKSPCGDQAHLTVDEDGFITSTHYTPGNVELMCAAHTIKRGLSIQQASCA